MRESVSFCAVSLLFLGLHYSGAVSRVLVFVLSVGCHSWDLLETLAQFGVTAPSAPISMGATGRISQDQPFLLSADGTCRAGACSFTMVPIFAPLLSRVSAESGID